MLPDCVCGCHGPAGATLAGWAHLAWRAAAHRRPRARQLQHQHARRVQAHLQRLRHAQPPLPLSCLTDLLDLN